MANDLTSLFQPGDKGPSAQVRQGVVESWDSDTGNNTIRVAGGQLLNVPALTGESASLQTGDVVALLSAGNRWFLLGKVTTPGDPGTVPSWTADITALTGQVDTIQTVTIPAVQGDVTIVQGDVIELSTVTVPAVQAAADAAQDTADSAASTASTAQSTADTAQSTATGAAADAATAQGTADSAASAAATAAADAATAQAAADAAQAAADSLQTDLDAAEADITTLTGTTLPALQSDVDAAAADVATLTGTTIPGLQSDLDAAAAAVVTAQAAADAAQSTADAILPIGSTDISDDAITTPKIAANAVTAAEIAANTITANEIAASAITASELNAGAVTTAKIAAGAVTATEIGAGAVTAVKIAADTITAAQIAASAITASELAANAVTAGKIAAGTIVAADIASGTITATQIAANTITAAKIAAGTITGTELSATSIDGKTITGALFRTAASGQRLEIDSAGAANEIQFFSGAASEIAPGYIKSDVVSGGAYTMVGSPDLAGGGAGQYAALQLAKIASTGVVTATLEASVITLDSNGSIELDTGSGTVNANGAEVMVVGGNPQPVGSSSATDITSVSNTSFAAGSPVVGIAVTAPATGSVYIVTSAHIASASTANSYIYVSPEVRIGGTVGSGTVVHTAVTDEGVAIGTNSTTIARVSASTEILVTGLTPGSTYNVRLMHLITAGTNGTIFYRAVLVKPVL